MPYAKAIVAAAAAGVVALGYGLQDGVLSAAEIGVAVGAILGSFGVTYKIPNKPPPQP